MLIAVPAETDPGKGRVAATPETVKKFIGLGAKVVVQSGAGLASGILDADSGWPSAPSPSPARSSRSCCRSATPSISAWRWPVRPAHRVIRGEGHFTFWLIVLVSSPSAFC